MSLFCCNPILWLSWQQKMQGRCQRTLCSLLAVIERFIWKRQKNQNSPNAQRFPSDQKSQPDQMFRQAALNKQQGAPARRARVWGGKSIAAPAVISTEPPTTRVPAKVRSTGLGVQKKSVQNAEPRPGIQPRYSISPVLFVAARWLSRHCFYCSQEGRRRVSLCQKLKQQ